MLRNSQMTTREKLVKMIEAEGFRDVEIFPALGAWRTNRKLDVARWEGWAKRGEGNVPYSLISFDTMTNLVRYGFTYGHEFNSSGFEFYAKIPPKVSPA